MQQNPHSFNAITALCAAGAGLLSAVTLYFNVKLSHDFTAATHKLSEQSRSLGELSNRLADFERQQVHVMTGGDSPGQIRNAPTASPNTNDVDQIAAAVADRVTERSQPEPAARTDANVAAFDDGNRIIESAIRAGHWTDREHDAMKALTPKLHPEDVGELLRRISVQINAGKLHPDSQQPLF